MTPTHGTLYCEGMTTTTHSNYAAGKAMGEPARRVIQGVEVPVTTTDLF